jgi:hypothetical protein
MRLRADYDRVAQSIRVCVSDCGTWYRRPATKSNDAYASRGIRLMHALSDHCTIDTRPDGTTVCLDYTADSKAVKNP